MSIGPLEVTFLAFIVGAIISGIAQQRFNAALASKARGVSRNDDVLNQFMNNPRGIPRQSFRESSRRLSALITEQTDPSLERLRRQALVSLVLPLGALLLLLALPGLYARGLVG